MTQSSPFFPIDQGSNTVIIGELRGINHAQDLIKIAPDTRRISQMQIEFLIRIDIDREYSDTG